MAERKRSVSFKTEILPPDGCTIAPDGFSSIEFHHMPNNSLSIFHIDGIAYGNYMYNSPIRVYDSGSDAVIETSFRVTKYENNPIQGFTIKKYH